MTLLAASRLEAVEALIASGAGSLEDGDADGGGGGDVIAILLHVLVAPHARRQRVGAAAVALLLSRAWEEGAVAAEAVVRADDSPSLALLRGAGFVAVEPRGARARGGGAAPPGALARMRLERAPCCAKAD